MALQALWDVTQQFNHKNGSILTSGKIYIYYKGRTALATSYHDEDGTVVNSNPVLLDNNGRSTAFVNPIYSYTIVVCDYYGKELFSQDITLHDAISTAEDVVIVGTDGSVLVDTTQLPNGVQYDLSVNTDIIATKQSVDDVKEDLDDLTVIVNQHTTQIEALQDDVEDLEDALANKKDKQTAKTFNGAATKTIKKITQNANGEMSVEFEDIDLPPEVPNVEITSPNGTIDVQSSTDVQTNTKTFTIDVKKGDVDYYIGSKSVVEVGTTNYNITNNLVRTEGNIDITQPGKGLYLVCVNANVRPSTTVNEQHEIWLSIGPNNTYTMMHSLDWTNLQDTDISSASIVKINGNEPISIYMSYGSTPSVGVDLTICNVSVYRLDSIIGQGGGGTTDIVIAREYNGVLDDTYDGVKIRQTDNGNEIVALRKNNSWFSYGQLVPLSAGSDKILITDANGTVHWGVVGTGLEIDNNTLEVQISGEVGDVVETVEKLSDDLDKKITTTYPFAQITSMGDFAQYGVSNTTRMIGQLFAVPIASEIRKDETVLCVNALQNFSGNVSFGIFEYDFEGNGGTGSTYWIADTGTVSVRAGENEFALKYVLNDAHELQSSKLYYAVIAVAANAPATGLLLGSSPAYAQNVNANPKYTLIVSNMDNYVDWSVGTLQGAWFQGYNEQYDIPRLFMMLRNGEGSTPIPVTEPFTDIGTFTLEHQYRVSDIFSLTPDAEGGVYRKIIPAQDVDIASFRYVDYHGSVSSQSSFPVLLDDTYTPMKAIGDGTWTLGNSDLTKVDGTHYVHEFTFTTPVHLTANTAYWFMVGGNMADQGSEWLITYQTPSVSNDLLLVKNMYNVNSWIIPNSGEFLASQPGMYLRLSDGTDNWTI